MHHIDKRNIIQCIAIISPALDYVQILTMQTISREGAMHKILPIMLALCLMLFSTNYAQNYASLIGAYLYTIHDSTVIANWWFRLCAR